MPSKQQWQRLYSEYKKAYQEQSNKTPMDDMYDYMDFKTYYAADVQRFQNSADTPKEIIKDMVKGQRNILTPKQIDALYRNAPKVMELYHGEALTRFFEETGWFLLKNPEDRYLWGEQFGETFKNQLLLWDEENWMSYFNS